MFYKLALANASGVAQPMILIANDGNLLPQPVGLTTETDHLGVAERFDIVVDFSSYAIGEKLHMVNLADHFDDEERTGRGAERQEGHHRSFPAGGPVGHVPGSGRRTGSSSSASCATRCGRM